MFERFLIQSRNAVRAVCGAALLAVALSGCGGSGAGAGGSASTKSAVADMLVMADKTALPSADGQSSSVVTVQLKDASNRVLANQLVEFSSTDSGVALSPVGTSALTDASGKIQVKVELGNTAAARLNRTVTVVAKSGELTRSINIAVAGFRLTLSGPDMLNPGATADYTVMAADGAGAPVAGLDLSATFDGGSLAASSVKTSASGQATVRVTAGTAARDATLAVAGTGVSTVSRTVRVLSNDAPFDILEPASPWLVSVNTPETVRVRYRPNGVKQAGLAVALATTRGEFAGGAKVVTLTTDAEGEATVQLSSAAAGTATLTASAVGGAASSVVSEVTFVSRSAAKITLSPDPTSIGANAPGSSSSTSRLVATVRDADDNPVTGATVAFSLQDPSGGRVEPGTVVTGTDGQAVATFVAGPRSTGMDQIQATATVVGAPTVSATRSMTVSAVALFIELGTGNEIAVLDTTSYAMPWTALVTDANRNPVANSRVTASLVATHFAKGYWFWVADPGVWVFQETSSPSCPSEDRNNNNLLDANEDVAPIGDGDGRLEPGSPASVTVTSTDGKTAADGRASLQIVYPKSFGGTVKVTLKVTIGGSSGTESSVYRDFWLKMLEDDMSDEMVAPPNFGISAPSSVTGKTGFTPAGPFGYASSCTDPN